MFSNMKIVTKVLLSFILAVLSFIIMGALGLNAVSGIADSANDVIKMTKVANELQAREVDHLKFASVKGGDQFKDNLLIIKRLNEINN